MENGHVEEDMKLPNVDDEEQEEQIEEQIEEQLQEQLHEQLQEHIDEELQRLIQLQAIKELLVEEIIDETRNETPLVMPCSSTTDITAQIGEILRQAILDDSSDETDDDGVEGDDDASSDDSQPRELLTVTYRCEVTNQEIPTATLIRKRRDPVDKFVLFVTAILRSISNEQLKQKVMEVISQLLLNAKTEGIVAIHRLHLQ